MSVSIALVGLPGASSLSAIPLNDLQWAKLEEIASEVASPGFSPSAGQMASVLLTLSLRSLRKDKDADQAQQDAAKSGSGELASVGE